MWTPTHVQVTVQQARKLIRKGKNETNDAYVMISLGKEKYQTSIRERSTDPEWHEECDLPIPDMTAVVHLNTYHRNLLGIDEFLGHVDIPLEQFHIYERPRNRWYVLKNKPGSKKAEKYRGEIEVKVMFMVHSLSGSQSRLDKTSKVKKSSSFKTIASAMGEKFKWSSRGSLTLNKTSGEAHSSFGESPTYKKDFLPTSYNNYESVDSSSHVSSLEAEDTPETPQNPQHVFDETDASHPLDADDKSETKHGSIHDDKAVLSDCEPTRRDGGVTHQKSASDCSSAQSHSDTRSTSTSHSDTSATSHRSTSADDFDVITPPASDTSQSSGQTSPPKTPSEQTSTDTSKEVPLSKNHSGVTLSDTSDTQNNGGDIGPAEEVVFYDKLRKLKDSSGRHTLQSGSSTPRRSAHELYESIYEYKKAQEEKASLSQGESLSAETISSYQDHSREDLIRLLTEQRLMVHDKDLYIKDLENYIDNLLVRVIESTPGVLQNPPSPMKPRQSASSKKTNPSPLAMPTNQSAWVIQNNQSVRASPNNQSQSIANQVKGVGYSSAKSQVSVMNSNNSNNTQSQKKSPFKSLHIDNPFAKIQAAFK